MALSEYTIRLDEELLEQFEAHCERHDCNDGYLVEDLIRLYLQEPDIVVGAKSRRQESVVKEAFNRLMEKTNWLRDAS